MLEGAEMFERSRQRAAVALLLGALIWLLAAGCGGGDNATTLAADDAPESTAATTSGLPETTTSVPGPTTSLQGSTTSVGVSTTFANTGLVDGMPAKYVESFGQRPIVVLFYVPGGLADEKVLKVVNELKTSFREYTFLTYDYKVPTAYGDLAQTLKITNQPQLVLIDRNANKYKVWSGYIDRGTLYQSLVNLGRL